MSDAHELIEIRHPETGSTITRTRKAFDSVWSKRGWVEVTASETPVEVPAEPKGEQDA